jgi:myo-inositol-1(or 4)-monophosphatase
LQLPDAGRGPAGSGADDTDTKDARMTGENAPRLTELLTLASDLAREAGRLHREGRDGALSIETKSSPTDLVSQIDRACERLIVDRLEEARPDDAVLAEEGTLRSGGSGVRWIIDPLDGTTNYVYGYPAFAVSIAVELEGRPAVGVVYESSAGHLYEAVAGHGARRDGSPIRARASTELSQALVATGFSYAAAQRVRQGAVAARVLGRVRDIRRAGSAALDLCHIAAGHVDAYWELDLSPWDYAAGGVIAREAGADVQFPEAAHGRGPAVVAAPPELMPPFLDLLREAGALA